MRFFILPHSLIPQIVHKTAGTAMMSMYGATMHTSASTADNTPNTQTNATNVQ